MDKDDYEQLEDLIKRFDLFSKNWIHSAMKTLSFIKTRSVFLRLIEMKNKNFNFFSISKWKI